MIDWEWYDDINVCRLFIHCLMRANHKPKQWRGIDVPRGSFITGRKKLAEETKLTEQQIRTALNKLISTNEITIKATNKNSLLTVVKYNDYQDKQDASTSKTTSDLTNGQPTSNQQVTTNNNDNNENNENNEKKGAKAQPVTRFVKPSLNQINDYSKLKNLVMDCESFFDHYESNGWRVGGKTPMKNWEAAMRQWAKRDFKGSPESKPKVDDMPNADLEKLAVSLGIHTQGMYRKDLISAVKGKMQ